MRCSQLQKLRDLDLDLGSGRGQTGAHIRSRSIYPHTELERNGKKLFVDVQTDGRTDRHDSRSIRS